VLFVSSSTHRSITAQRARAECFKNPSATGRVDHYLTTRAPRGAVLSTGKVAHYVGARGIREWLPLTEKAKISPHGIARRPRHMSTRAFAVFQLRTVATVPRARSTEVVVSFEPS